MRKTFWLSLTLVVGFLPSAFPQGTPQSTTAVDWFNNASTLFLNGAGVALTQGAPGTNSDGTLVQLGYFSAGTAANNFNGTWTPLTGSGATFHTTIGDSPGLTGLGNGRIGFSTVFHFGSSAVEVYDSSLDSGAYTTQSSTSITANPSSNTGAPPQGQVLGIRFYDVNNSTGHYNTVSSDSWTWSGPTELNGGAGLVLNVGTASLEWESVSAFGQTGTEFRTVLPVAVPEPSTYASALLGLGAIGFGAVRRRFKL